MKTEKVISTFEAKSATVCAVRSVDLDSLMDGEGDTISKEALKNAGVFEVTIDTHGRSPEHSRLAMDSEANAVSFVAGFAYREQMDIARKEARKAKAADASAKAEKEAAAAAKKEAAAAAKAEKAAKSKGGAKAN